MKMIEKLKKLLKIHNFSGEIELKDGTIVMVDGSQLEVGAKLFVKLPDNDEPVELPDGEYQLLDDSILVVEGGIVKDIIEPSIEEEPKEEVVEEVETAEEVVEEEPKEEVVEEDLTEKIKNLEDRLSALEQLMSKEEMEKIKQSSDRLTTEFNELKEKVSLSTDVKKLPLHKVETEPMNSIDRRYENIKKSLKNN